MGERNGAKAILECYFRIDVVFGVCGLNVYTIYYFMNGNAEFPVNEMPKPTIRVVVTSAW